jgi:lactoylglutathione lyase
LISKLNRHLLNKAIISMKLEHVAIWTARLEVDRKAGQLQNDGYQILDGPRVTGDGYYEFATLDPENNRIEVTTKAG